MKMEGLEMLHLVHARLLFIVAEMYKGGMITEDQKLSLKQFVFGEDEKIIQIYDANQDESQLDSLMKSLKELVS